MSTDLRFFNICFPILMLFIQLVMYVLRLGVISSLLSETLVSGFTTGAAIHVLTSQVKDLLGIHLSRNVDNFKIIFVSKQNNVSSLKPKRTKAITQHIFIYMFLFLLIPHSILELL